MLDALTDGRLKVVGNPTVGKLIVGIFRLRVVGKLTLDVLWLEVECMLIDGIFEVLSEIKLGALKVAEWLVLFRVVENPGKFKVVGTLRVVGTWTLDSLTDGTVKEVFKLRVVWMLKLGAETPGMEMLDSRKVVRILRVVGI